MGGGIFREPRRGGDRSYDPVVPAERTILHLDMDAFFASVEQRDDPALRGRPVLVGGRGGRGVVAAASYEARRSGCRSAMPMAEALRRCPEAVVVKPSFERYEADSSRIMEILETASPMVEPLSIDEAFIDVTGSRRLLGAGPVIARGLKQTIKGELGLTASVGVAPCKFVAKIASDLEKPDGLTVFEAEGVAARLASLPIERMWGIGPKSRARFEARGIRRFEDLQRWSPESLAATFGDAAARFHTLAHGVDDRPVVGDRTAKSIGHEQTFGVDLGDPSEVEAVLLRHVERVGTRLRRRGRRARSVVVKIRDGAFVTNTRSATLDRATDRTDLLWETARTLFRAWSFRPVRLIGMSAERFEDDDPGLFTGIDEEESRSRRLDAATDAIRDRFGGEAIARTAASFPPGNARERSEGDERSGS
ncbi:MAG: DNA polymerase IV [Planctomycetia bacterium]|jgi:DNA polymerase-4|nr:DNA polymerase IV [Planctomycetia bacterium]